MPKLIDITGQRFGRWTVTQYAGCSRWLCRCDCGTERDVISNDLRDSKSRSCGCLQREKAKQNARLLTLTHDRSRTPEYKAWKAMIKRCENPHDVGFASHGARGITVDPEWRSDFMSFYRDIGPRPSPAYSLDRIDNDGPYAPGNCRWATRTIQARNMTTNRLVSFNGQRQCVAAWAEELGISRDVLYHRLDEGWSVQRAFTEPVHSKANSCSASLS